MFLCFLTSNNYPKSSFIVAITHQVSPRALLHTHIRAYTHTTCMHTHTYTCMPTCTHTHKGKHTQAHMHHTHAYIVAHTLCVCVCVPLVVVMILCWAGMKGVWIWTHVRRTSEAEDRRNPRVGFSRGSEHGVATLQEAVPSGLKCSFCVFGRLCLDIASLCVMKSFIDFWYQIHWNLILIKTQ